MTVQEALAELKVVLDRGFYPNAIPGVEKTLASLEQSGFEKGFERAKDTVGEWHKPLSY